MVARYRTPWYLRAYGLIAPRRAAIARALHRIDHDEDYARRVDDVMRVRGYRDARSADGATPWASSIWPRSADSEILGDLGRLRSRSREVARDDAVGAGIVRAYRDGIVGTGIDDRAMTGRPEWDTVVDEVWREIRDDLFPAENVSWIAIQRLLATRRVEDGEVFVKRTVFPGDDRLLFEAVEADRVYTPLDARRLMLDPEGSIREGVERDRWGRIRRYWVANRHPGDTQLTSSFGGLVQGQIHAQPLSADEFTAVEKDGIRHLHLVSRPGQSRSVPVMHAVLQDLRDLDFLVSATLKRFGVAASFALFIESPEDVFGDLVDSVRKKYGYVLEQDLQPGMIMSLFPGEKVSTANPNFPMPDVEALAKIVARRIGTSIGVSWQIVLSDFSDASFAGGRLDRDVAENTWDVPRSELVETLSWVREQALQDAALRGDPRLEGIPMAALGKATWIAPAKATGDPSNEASAQQTLREIGALSMRDLMASYGRDWKEHERQLAREEEFRRSLREPNRVNGNGNGNGSVNRIAGLV